MKKSIAFKLSFRFMLLVALILVLLANTFTYMLRLSIRKRQSNELYNSALTLCNELKNDYEPSPELSEIPYYITYLIYEKETEEILYTNDPFLPKLPETSGGTKKYYQKDYFSDGDMNILYCALDVDGKYIVETAVDIESDFAMGMFKALPKVLAFAIIPILLISFLLSLVITKETMKPVKKITAAAQKMSSTNLEQLLPESQTGDEIDELSKTFNKLFESLRNDFVRERNFTSDVSHELKTPVAGILGQANLLKRWGKDNPAQLEQSLDMIITEANAMNSIITNLLQISKLEKGLVQLQKAEVSLWSLFERLKQEFLGINPDIIITFDEDIALSINTDVELLHQVMVALISNSIKYGAKTITLSAKEQDGQLAILTEDDGPGFGEEVLPHVFERFYRGDAAHTRGAGGAGLGLSISKSIIGALGGNISADNSKKTGGAVVTIIL